MRQTFIRVAFISLALVPIALFVLGMFFFMGDGYTRLNGEVVGLDYKPVAGVEVRLLGVERYREARLITDESGLFSVGFTHEPSDIKLVVTATKKGYKEFQASEWERVPKKIVLELDGEAATPSKN